MRVGIMGGTFDPVHLGHLIAAEQCREQLALDHLRFIPAAVSPFKLDKQTADARHRVEMLQLATGGNPGFVVDDREIRRGGTSFTVDTLRQLREEFSSAELVFLMGADSLVDFDKWREPAEIARLARIVVVARGGHAQPDMAVLAKYLPKGADLSQHLLAMPACEISSTARCAPPYRNKRVSATKFLPLSSHTLLSTNFIDLRLVEGKWLGSVCVGDINEKGSDAGDDGVGQLSPLLCRGGVRISRSGVSRQQMPGSSNTDPALFERLVAQRLHGSWIGSQPSSLIANDQFRAKVHDQRCFHFARMVVRMLANFEGDIANHLVPIAQEQVDMRGADQFAEDRLISFPPWLLKISNFWMPLA